MVYGGESYGNNAPSPFQVFKDVEMLKMQRERLELEKEQAKRTNDARWPML